MTAFVSEKESWRCLHLHHSSVEVLNWMFLYLFLVSWCWLDSSFAIQILKFKAPNDLETLTRVAVNTQNGDVFVAGQNNLYQLTRDLQLKQTYKLGQTPANLADCKTKNNCSVRNNDGTVLEIDSEGRFLLYCGHVLPGACNVFQAENLTHVEQLTLNCSESECISGASLLGVFGKYTSDEYALFIAISFDRSHGTNNSAEIVQSNWKPAITSFSSVSQRVGFNANHHNKKTFDVQYLYGFEHNDFVYFLTIQQEFVFEPFNFETRLVRVCKGDHDFVSYTEVKLSCSETGVIGNFYNVAVAAHLTPVNDDSVNRFDPSSNNLALFVVFGKSLEGSGVSDEKFGYGLCEYTLDDIEKEFVNAQRDCYEGSGRRLEWINQDDPPCLADTSQVTEIGNKFCGDKRNAGIGGRYPLTKVSHVTIQDHIPTALLVSTFQRKTIALIGTANGHLLKYLIDGTNSGPYADLDMFDGQTIGNDMAFHIDKKHVYVLTGSKISSIPIQSCSIYMSCAACIMTQNTLNCGWCDGHCTTKDTCHSIHWSTESCPPILETFHPRTGPVHGGTKLTILGQNFGTGAKLAVGSLVSSSMATVVVAGSVCSIEFHNATCIICQTGPALMMKALEKGIKVTVNDPSKSTASFNISGSSSSGSLMFSYQIPRVTYFLPTVGPASGGTSLTIRGLNLDIGSSRHVKVANQFCSIERISATEIVCNTSAFDVSTHHLPENIPTSGFVNVRIDSAPLGFSDVLFTYKEDPVITTIFPQKSIISGGMSITAFGMNLDVVQRPVIVAHFSNGLRFSENCSSVSDGKMTCLSPDVSDAISQPLAETPLNVMVEFLMDNAKNILNANLSNFIYEVNPKVDSFSGRDKIRTFYMDENYLEIAGQNLDLGATADDYQVLIGKANCSKIRITSSLLFCEPVKSDILPALDPSKEKEVKVLIGRLVFRVGFLRFSERQNNSFMMLTTAPIVGSAAIVIVILLFYLMHRLWRRKLHRDFFSSYPSHAVNPLEANVLPNEARIDDLQNSYQLEESRNVHQNSEDLPDNNGQHFVPDPAILIPKERVVLKDVIGQGHFGCVHRGILQTSDGKSKIEVAVKTMKINEETAAAKFLAVQKFYDEALLMTDFDHDHILRLIGIVQGDDGLPLVVLPFMHNGDLLTYIRCGENAPTVRELMEFGIQVAEGMAYLSNLKYVHRDLAARNCMLDEKMVIKVADFGLSRDVYEKDYYSCNNRHTKLPVKWMALESLEKGIYNSKTDVWSYGVVLWELLTRGMTPYPEVDNWDVVRFLKSGRRMSQPSFAPDDLYTQMLICWHPVPNIRPTFNELAVQIRTIIRSLECVYRPVELNISVSYANIDADDIYLNPRPAIDSESSIQNPDNLQYSGFLDTAV